MVKMLLSIILDFYIKLLKFPFIQMAACRTAARGNTFIWIYVRLCDLTFTQTAWQMHYFKTKLDTAGLSGCIPVT